MIVWRLADPRFARDLAGTGNRIHGGRWNSPGRGLVYCAETLSLCVLENLVHLPPAMRGALPPRVAIRIEIPDIVKSKTVLILPRGMKGQRLSNWCCKLGDQWIDDGETLVLRAPSVVVEQEQNVMLNPAHAAMRGVKILDVKPFAFDGRLS
jgi:RES domain-containing protein